MKICGKKMCLLKNQALKAYSSRLQKQNQNFEKGYKYKVLFKSSRNTARAYYKTKAWD